MTSEKGVSEVVYGVMLGPMAGRVNRVGRARFGGDWVRAGPTA